MRYFLKRLREPSSHAGIAAVGAGFAYIFGQPGAEQIGAVAAETVSAAVTGNWIGAGIALASGLAAVMLPEGEKG